MKVTICQMRDEADLFQEDWIGLVGHAQREKPDIILLPEMAFSPWFVAQSRFDHKIWNRAVLAHDEADMLIQALAPSCVLGSRPLNNKGKRLNQAFTWNPASGLTLGHTKYYLPNEDGFWEANWYQRGDGSFQPVRCQNANIGFLICTELWFFEHARLYAKNDVHLIACPRATPRSSLEKWLAGGRVAAVVSGAYCASSNKISIQGSHLGGQGWIADPEGNVLGVTTRDTPFLTVDIDLKMAEQAKQTYPRYVRD